MESKTSFFSKAIYVKTLKRFFPWSICYGLILLFFLPVMTALRLSVKSNPTDVIIGYGGGIAPLLVITVACAALFAAALIFSYLFRDTASNAMHALPVSRKSHLTSNLLAGLTLLLLPLLLAEGITMLTSSLATGFHSPQALLFHAKLTGGLCLMTVLFFNIAIFCAMLSGHLLTMPALYVIINFFSIGVGCLVSLFKEWFFFGFGYSWNRIYSQCSPLWELVQNFCNVDVFVPSGSDTITRLNYVMDFRFLIVYCVLSLLLLLLSYVLYQKRSLECAGDILAFPRTSWFFQALFGIATGIIVAGLFTAVRENLLSMPYVIMLLFLAGSFFGFFAGRMLIRKRFFIFREALPGFLIYGICALALMLVTELDLAGYEKRVPDISDVKTVSLNPYEGTSSSDKDLIQETIRIHRLILEQKKELEKRASRFADYPDYEILDICYRLENGAVISRSYPIHYRTKDLQDPDSVIVRYFDLMNSPQAVKSYYFADGFTEDSLRTISYQDYETYEEPLGYYQYVLSTDEQRALIRAIFQDIEERNILGESYFNGSYDGPLTSCALDPRYFLENHRFYSQSLELVSKNGKTFYLQLEEGAVHTIEALKKLNIVNGQHPLTSGDSEDRIFYH